MDRRTFYSTSIFFFFFKERRHHRDAWTDTIDSQASSTQTAHSWVHGGAPVRESVVRPTRSFEYLPGKPETWFLVFALKKNIPGDVYENSNNIREVLPSETSQNVITESESSAESVERVSDSDGKSLLEKNQKLV